MVILILIIVILLALTQVLNAIKERMKAQDDLILALNESITELEKTLDLYKISRMNRKLIKVSSVAPDYRAGAYDRLHNLALELEEENERLSHVIKCVLNELPSNKDWLNPELEKVMKNIADNY